MPQHLTPAEVIKAALKIAKEFQQDGMTLSLRQLYYQFVARGLTGNGDAVYKRIGSVLTDARFNGDFPIDWIEDRGRDVGEGDWRENDDDVDMAFDQTVRAIRSCPFWYLKRSRWWGQEKIVSVWVEKEALSGVFQDPCEELGVALFPCRGYPSVSALWAWHQEIVATREKFLDELGFEPEPVILYFGDFDPDGLEIPDSAVRSLYRLHELNDDGYNIELERMALNLDQIRKYKPPPFAAKKTSARYATYVKKHGIKDAWELDALEPRVLRKLIRDGVAQHFNEGVYQRHQGEIERVREDLRKQMKAPGLVNRAFK
jgi:hypothetical protein